jgi:hypothetical protein
MQLLLLRANVQKVGMPAVIVMVLVASQKMMLQTRFVEAIQEMTFGV